MLNAIAAAIERGLRRVVATLVLGYLLLVLAQVLFRYVFNMPLFWAEELVRYGFVWSVMLGSVLVAYEKGHLKVDGVEALLPPRGARIVARTTDMLTLAFLAALVFAGVDFVARTINQTSASLELPIWVVYAAIPVGAVLEFIATAATMRKPPHEPDPESSLL